MNYWLIKSEPDAWSWDQQAAKGAKGDAWTGVRNHTAKLNLMKMKKGDRAFFYHSGESKAVVGIVEIIRESYPDPSAAAGDPWVAVDVKALTPLGAPVTLCRDQVRAEAQGHDADQAVTPVGAAGRGIGMVHDLSDGRGHGVGAARPHRRTGRGAAAKRVAVARSPKVTRKQRSPITNLE